MIKEDKDIESNHENSVFSPAWKTADPYFYHLLKEQRKEMRDNMTEAEKILWENLKSNKLGIKFRRQHLIECFIPDFVALSCKLIIEVDGEIHNFQKKYDFEREQFLIQKGYRLIRFKNDDILNNLEMVLKKIKENIFKK
jgi:very-short-patch-repair endonuclease